MHNIGRAETMCTYIWEKWLRGFEYSFFLLHHILPWEWTCNHSMGYSWVFCLLTENQTHFTDNWNTRQMNFCYCNSWSISIGVKIKQHLSITTMFKISQNFKLHTHSWLLQNFFSIWVCKLFCQFCFW